MTGQIKKPELVNARLMHQRFPDTFYYPDEGQLQSIVPGNYVKVCFDDTRFWVIIQEVWPEHLLGTIDNDININGMSSQDVIEFTKDNIYDIINDDTVLPDFGPLNNMRATLPHVNRKITDETQYVKKFKF